MKKIWVISLILVLPALSHSKVIIEDADNGWITTDLRDENGNKIGSVSKDNYGTRHIYDNDGNKIKKIREDGFEQSAVYEENSDKKDP